MIILGSSSLLPVHGFGGASATLFASPPYLPLPVGRQGQADVKVELHPRRRMSSTLAGGRVLLKIHLSLAITAKKPQLE